MMYRQVSINACKPLVLTHHYSGRMPSGIKLCYGDVDSLKITMACSIFSLATGRWEAENLWELTRLVRLPDYASPLTRLISNALGHIRKHRLADLIISFADAEEDHHGGIYQASSWVYGGIVAPRLDGFNIDGLFVPARTCNQRYGTSSEVELKRKLSRNVVEPHYDCAKHRYWKAVSKAGMVQALRLGFKSLPYPKPMLENGTPRNSNRGESDPQLKKGRIVLPEIEVEENTKPKRLRIGEDITKNPAD